jgi:hypothetical protein
MTGRLIVITPNGTHSVTEIKTAKGPTLKDLQTAVGGYIERVRVRYDGRVRDAYIHEEGLILGLPVNNRATSMLAAEYNTCGGIRGPLAVWVPDPKAKKTLLPGDPLGGR